MVFYVIEEISCDPVSNIIWTWPCPKVHKALANIVLRIVFLVAGQEIFRRLAATAVVAAATVAAAALNPQTLKP